MRDLIWLSNAQMQLIKPYFPLSHGVPRVDDRKVVSGIIFVIRNGLCWRDAPAEYGPHKTICNRFIRWSRLGMFSKIFAGLAAKGGKPGQLMIDATHLKAHRTAASLPEKGITPCAPSGSNRKIPVPHDKIFYRQSHKIENMFAKLKDWRRIHTRYDRCAHTFFSSLCIAATFIFWINQ